MQQQLSTTVPVSEQRSFDVAADCYEAQAFLFLQQLSAASSAAQTGATRSVATTAINTRLRMITSIL